jgi:hypothetical protein
MVGSLCTLAGSPWLFIIHATYSAVLKSFESAPVLQEAAGLMVVELLLPKASSLGLFGGLG